MINDRRRRRSTTTATTTTTYDDDDDEDDDDDDDDEEEEEEELELQSQQQGESRARMAWEDDEAAALVAGIAAWGPGQWGGLKTDPRFSVLGGRTNASLKEKW